MNYYSVKNRCAVDLVGMHLPVSIDQSLEILKKKGFEEIDINIVEIARQCISASTYRRGARVSEAPRVFDCSSFIKWLYGQKGIWLPRRSIQQRELGTDIPPENMRTGDIVFTSGFIDYYLSDPNDGVGHVGIATECKTVIHAANSKSGIIESPLDSFIKDKFRGIKRVIPENHKIFTFITPPEREVEWSDDIRWIILQNISG